MSKLENLAKRAARELRAEGFKARAFRISPRIYEVRIAKHGVWIFEDPVRH